MTPPFFIPDLHERQACALGLLCEMVGGSCRVTLRRWAINRRNFRLHKAKTRGVNTGRGGKTYDLDDEITMAHKHILFRSEAVGVK